MQSQSLFLDDDSFSLLVRQYINRLRTTTVA